MFAGVAVMAESSLPDLPLPPEKWRQLRQSLHLPRQQLRVVELILRNCSDKQIAAEIGIAIPTVRTHLTRTFARLGVENRMGLVLKLFAASHRLK